MKSYTKNELERKGLARYALREAQKAMANWVKAQNQCDRAKERLYAKATVLAERLTNWMDPTDGHT